MEIEDFDRVINLDPHYHARMKSIGAAMTTDPVFLRQINRTLGELVYFSWKDKRPDDDPNREAYLTTNPQDKARIIQIGKDLNAFGGLDVMQFVAQVLGTLVKGASDIRTLDFAWDGIGEWRC